MPASRLTAELSAPLHRDVVSTTLSHAGWRARAAFRIALALTVAVAILADGSTPPTMLAVVLALSVVYLAGSTFFGPPATPLASEALVDDSSPVPAGRPPIPPVNWSVLRAAGDVIVLCAMAVAVQGPRSVILLVLCAVVLSRSLTLSPEALAVLTAGAIGGVLIVWAIGVVAGPQTISDSNLLLLAFALGWSGLISALIAVERDRRAGRIRELGVTLRELIGQVLHAETSERQRVADLLHDDVLQLLLATRHDVTDAIEGDLDALRSARTGIDAATRSLRQTIGGLRTDGVAAEALGQGVCQLADEAAQRRGFTVQVQVDPTLQHMHHPLLLSLTRDLLRDVERSSAPKTMSVVLRAEESDLLLLIEHDDRRRSLARPTPASHGVLAAVDQRTRAAGGTFTAARLEDGERLYTVRVPARPNDPAASSPADDAFSSPPTDTFFRDPPVTPTVWSLSGRRRSRSYPTTPPTKAPHDVSPR